MFLTIGHRSKQDGAAGLGVSTLVSIRAFPTASLYPAPRSLQNTLKIMGGKDSNSRTFMVTLDHIHADAVFPPLSTTPSASRLGVRAVRLEPTRPLRSLDRAPRRNPIHERRVYLFRHARKGMERQCSCERRRRCRYPSSVIQWARRIWLSHENRARVGSRSGSM